MTAYIIILVLLSALFHAFWNYLSKVSYSPQLFLAWVAIVNIAISIAVFLVRTPVIPSSIWVYMKPFTQVSAETPKTALSRRFEPRLREAISPKVFEIEPTLFSGLYTPYFPPHK